MMHGTRKRVATLLQSVLRELEPTAVAPRVTLRPGRVFAIKWTLVGYVLTYERGYPHSIERYLLVAQQYVRPWQVRRQLAGLPADDLLPTALALGVAVALVSEGAKICAELDTLPERASSLAPEIVPVWAKVREKVTDLGMSGPVPWEGLVPLLEARFEGSL